MYADKRKAAAFDALEAEAILEDDMILVHRSSSSFTPVSRRVWSLLLLLSVLLSAMASQPLPIQAHSGDILALPIGSTPPFDGHCLTSNYNDALPVTITGFNIPVQLKRDADFLYICFSGMELGGATQQVSVYLDRDHTGTTSPQPGDFVFRITRTSATSGGQGDGVGGYTAADPGGWSALKSESGGEFSTWDAQFRISMATAGGWNHVVGLALEARAINPNALSLWPGRALNTRPDTWADLVLSGQSWRPPDSGNCFPLFNNKVVQVQAGASPDLGGIPPAVLLSAGTTVHLTGVAQELQLSPFCQPKVTPLPFVWTLAFQPAGGLPADATASLQNANTLSPTFVASQPGTYFAQLVASGRIAKVQIEVLRSGRNWFSIGPNGSVGPTGKGVTSVGRLNALSFDPANPTSLYVGSALGGVWKSTDRGGSWSAMSDHKNLPTLAVGALAVAPNGTVYASTGDSHPNDDGLWQGGSGIWKSTDGGVGWQPTGTTTNGCPDGSVAFTGTANRIVINPNNPNVMYVAARPDGKSGPGGFFRSLNGGACWKKLSLGLNPINNVTDVVLDPTNPTTLYVATPHFAEGLWKTTNAEADFPTIVPLTQLPVVDNYNYIVIAVAPSAPNTVYAALSVDNRTDFIKSTNGGGTWQQGKSLCGRQCDYNTALAVSPTDPNRVIYGEVSAWQSTNGTQTWSELRNDSVHSDFHTLTFAPDDPNALYAATDGGVFRITLPPSANPTPRQGWTPRNLDLDDVQPPGLGLAPTNSQTAAIGVWDNGTWRRLSGRTWQSLTDNDGFYAQIDAVSDQIIYYTIQGAEGGEFARYPDRADLGGTDAYLSNPYRPGELFGIGANGKPVEKLYVTESANTIPKADWRCADPAPSSNATAFTLEFGSDGSYFESMTDGSIYRFTLPQQPANVAVCGQGQPPTAAQNATLVYSSGMADRPVVSVDRFDAKTLYAVFPNNPGASRVLRISQNNNGTWTATPLAGTPGSPGSLPTSIPSISGWSLYGGIAADPRERAVLSVGTTNGLWDGVPQADGSYAWSLDPDVPDSWVLGITPHRSVNGYSGVLRLTTYGRGVWERRIIYDPCPISCIELRAPTVNCLNCLNSFDDLHMFPQPVPRPADGEAWIAVPYSYQGEAGSRAYVRANPMANGVDQPYFLGLVQQVGVGSDTAFLVLRYAASSAPPSLHTDALRLELLSSASGQAPASVIASMVVPFDKWWLRPEVRLLMVDAQDKGLEPISISMPLTITVAGGAVTSGTAPLTMVVPLSATVSVEAPVFFNAVSGPRAFRYWTAEGMLVDSAPSVNLTVGDDTTLIANYTTPPGLLYIPLITR